MGSSSCTDWIQIGVCGSEKHGWDYQSAPVASPTLCFTQKQGGTNKYFYCFLFFMFFFNSCGHRGVSRGRRKFKKGPFSLGAQQIEI